MTAKRKRGRPCGPEGKREHLNKTDVLVAPSTRLFLHAVRAAYGVPIGRTIDALVSFARTSPNFRLPLTGARPNLQTFTPPNHEKPA